jgi:predicted lactoylglutathione lyase
MFSIGQRVKAQWTNGSFYGARINGFNGAQYEVIWDDGSAPLWLSPHQIQHEGAPAAGGGQFAIGQHVKAQWTNGAMYGARITNFNGAQYEVAWDDGSAPLWLAPHQIQVEAAAAVGGGQFTPGQRVKAQWTNGAMYGARITNFNGAQYEVAWDDGSAPLWLSPHQIQHDTGGGGAAGGSQFTPGQHVRAQWTNGAMYGARITNFNGSMYEVAWDDGSAPLWLAPHQIQADNGVGGMEMQRTGAGISMTGGQQFAIGQHVLAQWTNGSFYGAYVIQYNGSHYEVKWDDGSPNLWLAPHQIRAS